MPKDLLAKAYLYLGSFICCNSVCVYVIYASIKACIMGSVAPNGDGFEAIFLVGLEIFDGNGILRMGSKI